MPLPKRVVEPVHVARGTIPEDFPLPSELEAATNGTLANTVRQLSSLSRHAEDLFGELTREAHGLAARANSLQTRIDRLAVKVTQLDSNVEEVSLQDIHMRKAFKSSVVFDQQVVSRDTMPTAMLETYQTCDKPPPLDKLNSYREDGKDGLKFYTDANYFFDLWRQEMLKDTERMMHDRGKKPHRPRSEGGGGRHKKRVRQPHNTRERQRQLAVGHGEYIMPQNVHYRTPQPDEALLTMGMVMSDPRPPRPNSIELRRSYPDHVDMVYSGNSGVYSPRHTQSPAESHYRANYPVGYEESLYQQHYAQGQSVAGESYPTPNNHTPSRSNGTRANSQRPSQPPPAPPSTNNSSNSTPTVSSATNTPTRGRSMSAGRETLPPPPPPPVETVGSPPGMNGPLPSHLRSRSRSGSRSGSPLPVSTHSTPTPPSNHNTPHSHSLSRDNTPEPQQLPQTDLPPPPPTPEQQQQQQQQLQQQQQTVPSPPAPLSAQQRPTSPPCNIPPPPPPPPPPPMTLPNGPLSPPPACGVPMSPPLVNGDVGKSPLKQIISTSPPKQSPPKTENPSRNKLANSPAPAFDPRSDLLKAIRDGIKLRKVEKNEQKEVERVNALHDVASILARRVAVEFSDSDSASESEYDSEGWGEQETSA